MKELKEYIRSIPDFPEKGIIFRDVTSVLQDADALKLSIDELAKRLEGVDFDVIAGAESRGFISLGHHLLMSCISRLYRFVKKENGAACVP